MASPQRIYTLNLGTQTIGLAEFQVTEKGGLVLNRYDSTEVLADPALEATRVSQVRLAVSELRGKMGIKKGVVNYAIPSQQVFTRFVKLPTVAEEKVEQIITFEAQQNVPFPIDEVVWDYQLVSTPEASQVEVALFAVKADLLDEINQGVEDSGLRAGIVDVAPMALFNAFRYNYSDVDGCSLLVDIGARTTNLVFIDQGRMFVRSIHVGGANSITAQIAKELNWSFQQAEERKKAEGFVSLGGAYADPPDPDVALMSKVIRQTMTRLHQQVLQSISIYKAQQGGRQPQRVYLCGGSVALPYMREFFSEKMNCPIEFFNPLRNVAVTGNIDIEQMVRNAHVLGELVGLALRGMSNCPVELNLRPASVVRAQEMVSRRPFLVLASLCAMLAVAVAWVYFMQAKTVQQATLERVQAKVTEMTGFENKFKALKKEEAELQQRAAPLLNAVSDRGYWLSVIDDINSRLPKDKTIWITSFEPVLNSTIKAAPTPPPKPGQKPPQQQQQPPQPPAYTMLKIKGLYAAVDRGDQRVTDFVQNLMKSDYFEAGKIEEMMKRDAQDASAWAFSYELNLKLKKPLPAQ